MKIFIICSKRFYNRIPPILETLQADGHEVTLPNSYDDPGSEDRHKAIGEREHQEWKAGMMRHSAKVIREVDAVLVLNFEKDGWHNYIGGATFLEMYDAFREGRKIFLYNCIPDGILADEIRGFNPGLLHQDLDRINW